MHIKVKNFKIFKEQTLFEIMPITILAGPNNSGKSTLIKLLKLLKNGVEELKFSKTDYNNTEFKNILNWDSQNAPLEITIPYTTLWNYKQEVNLIYSGAILEKIELISQSEKNEKVDEEKPLLTIRSEGWPHSLDYSDSSDVDFYVSLNIEELINRFLYEGWVLYNELSNGELKVYDINDLTIENTAQYSLKDFYSLREAYLQDLPNRPIDYSQFFAGIKSDDETAMIEARKAYLEARQIEYERSTIVKNNEEKQLKKENELIDIYRTSLNNEISSLKERKNLYCLFIEEQDVTEQYYDEIIKAQTELFNADLEFLINLSKKNKGLLSNIRLIIEVFIDYQITYMHEHFENLIDFNFRLEPSRLHQLLFTEKYVGINITQKKESLDTYLNNVLLGENFESTIKYNFSNSINYLSPRRGSHQKVLLKSGKHDINNEVAEYVENKNTFSKSNKISDYIKTVLRLFNIDGKLQIESFHDSAYALFIEKPNGQKVNIADFGFGISQLIPIILKIANLAYNNVNFKGTVDLGKEILIIEEPESNLHPDFQAKLADFFSTTIQFFNGPKLILESHSEYLIRRLQYLVASKEMKKEDVIINYFNNDEALESGDPKVKHIRIEHNGNLSDSLGTGFLDETTKLQFELLKLNNRKS